VAIPELGTSIGIGSFSEETPEEFRRMKGKSEKSISYSFLDKSLPGSRIHSITHTITK
jgi:hypothetical protein